MPLLVAGFGPVWAALSLVRGSQPRSFKHCSSRVLFLVHASRSRLNSSTVYFGLGFYHCRSRSVLQPTSESIVAITRRQFRPIMGVMVPCRSLMLDTTIAGSLPKPEWLAPPNTFWAPWRLEGRPLEEGKRDAVLLALREQEQAGIDIVTDGEQTRRHFVWGFVEQLDGIDFSRMVTIGIRADRYKATVPTVTGAVGRRGSTHGEEVRWARANTKQRLKLTMPGPMTIVDTIHDAHYGSRERLAMDLARLINEEARELEALG